LKKKILLVFGTRPEAIKMAPLVKTFQKHSDQFDVSVCTTGQHREMLDQVLTLFEIKTDYDLNIMQHQQDLFDVTSRILIGMREVLQQSAPDIVLVHGDTVTALSVSLAAFYQKIAIGHVEAGLRTYNRYSPWPEEMNRRLTTQLATFHFAPTRLAQENLLSENVKESCIQITGNTVIDALQLAVDKISASASMKHDLEAQLSEAGYNPDRLTKNRRLILITGHRRENFGDGFVEICQALKTLAEAYPAVDFVYPVHLNPNVQVPVRQLLRESANRNIFLIPPLSYLPFVYLMKESYLLLTDSGGIQEEAPGLGKPVLVMRDTTERPEAVEAGTVRLVGANAQCIVSSVRELLNNDDEYQKMTSAHNPYGDGHASERIVDFLAQTSS
jgi:UDP-N-acetylglucosamine 2-epimerase (non-hydrolysing)